MTEKVRIEAIAAALAALEESDKWESEREDEINVLVKKNGYELGNCRCCYNYGSTPFESWEKVFQYRELRDYVENGLEERVYCVLGSSTGWMVFYGVEYFTGITAVGVDLLESQIEVSREMVERFGIENCEFYTKDAVEYVREHGAQIGVCIVSSLCWHSVVRYNTFYELLRTMRAGSCVIAYHNEEIDAVLYDEWKFELVHEVKNLAFSWRTHPSRSLYIYRKVKSSSRLSKQEIIAQQAEYLHALEEQDAEHLAICNLFSQ